MPWEIRNLNPDDFEEWVKNKCRFGIPHSKNPTYKLKLPDRLRQFLFDVKHPLVGCESMTRQAMREIVLEHAKSRNLFKYPGLSIFDIDLELKKLLKPQNSCMHVDDLDAHMDDLFRDEEEDGTIEKLVSVADPKTTEQELRSAIARLEQENKALVANNKEIKEMFVGYVKDHDPSPRSNKYLFLLLDKLCPP